MCSGSAKKDCASFESVCYKDDKGDENLFVVSDDDDTVKYKQIRMLYSHDMIPSNKILLRSNLKGSYSDPGKILTKILLRGNITKSKI